MVILRPLPEPFIVGKSDDMVAWAFAAWCLMRLRDARRSYL